MASLEPLVEVVVVLVLKMVLMEQNHLTEMEPAVP